MQTKNRQINYDCPHCIFQEIKDGLYGYVCTINLKPIEEVDCFRETSCSYESGFNGNIYDEFDWGSEYYDSTEHECPFCHVVPTLNGRCDCSNI